jgi:hypothetical protein
LGKAEPFLIIGSRDEDLKNWIVGAGKLFSSGEKGMLLGRFILSPGRLDCLATGKSPLPFPGWGRNPGSQNRFFEV